MKAPNGAGRLSNASQIPPTTPRPRHRTRQTATTRHQRAGEGPDGSLLAFSFRSGNAASIFEPRTLQNLVKQKHRHTNDLQR